MLAAASDPLSAQQIGVRLRRRRVAPEGDAVALLELEVAAGRAFRYGAPQEPRYWWGDADSYAKALIERSLARKPTTLAALHKQIGTQIPGYAAERVTEIVDHLLAVGRAHRHPGGTAGRGAMARADRFSAFPADPKAYLGALVTGFLQDLDREVERLASYGINRADSYAAAHEWLSGHPLCGAPGMPDRVPPGRGTAQCLTGSALEDCLLEGVRVLGRTRHHGGLVAIRELREAIGDRCADKGAFDTALLGLARSNRVWLYRHDFPASLSAEEREGMTADGQGSYYNGVSLRE